MKSEPVNAYDFCIENSLPDTYREIADITESDIKEK